MSVLAEVERLEAIDADVGLGENGKANLERARRALESQKRQERRDRAAARQTLNEKLKQHEEALETAYAALQGFIQARKDLDTARAECVVAERSARAADVLDRTHRAHEIQWFDRSEWRKFHDDARSRVTGSLL